MKTIVISLFTSAFIAVITLAGCEKPTGHAAAITGTTQSFQIVNNGQYLGELQITDNGENIYFHTFSATEVAQITRFNIYNAHCDSLRMDTSSLPHTPVFTWQDSFTRETATEVLAFGNDQRCLCVLPIVVDTVRNADTQNNLSLSTDIVGEPIRFCR